VKRSWTKAITNENFSKPLMPETKKHKASSDVTATPPMEESMIIPSPTKTDYVQTEKTHRTNDKNEPESISPPVVKEATEILNNSDKENKSLDNEKISLSEQVCKFLYFHILTKCYRRTRLHLMFLRS